MTHPPQEGSIRGLPSGTLLSVLWQMCHVWIIYGIVSGSVQVTDKQSNQGYYLPSHIPIDICWGSYHAWNTYGMPSRDTLMKPDEITHGTISCACLRCAIWMGMCNRQTCDHESITSQFLVSWQCMNVHTT